ncbi:hypothetical protein ABI59_13575 [Acidobacteria bacterium Mor1]|nr:hypothetical protein ABI59_13575 [Acidobacteria bacterium Mor1]
MASDRLRGCSLAVIEGCLRAAADGPFFEDREFSLLHGVDRQEVRSTLATFKCAELDETAELAIHNSMGNLLGYPHGMADEIPNFVPGGMKAIQETFTIWLDNAPSRGR